MASLRGLLRKNLEAECRPPSALKECCDGGRLEIRTCRAVGGMYVFWDDGRWSSGMGTVKTRGCRLDKGKNILTT